MLKVSSVLCLIFQALDGIAFCGKVDCDSQPDICDRAMIQAYPTVYFYRGAINGKPQVCIDF